MKNKILDILTQTGEYVSGEKLSQLCGVSRTAVWKQVNKLKEEGYQIESQSRIGYRLVYRPDKLIKTELLEGLQTLNWGKHSLYTFDNVDSTNNIAKDYGAQGKPEGTVIVAESQSRGKGRLGRLWASPAGQGIWASIILRPSILPTLAPQITLVMAVGMAKALNKIEGIEAKIKWPNDILVNNRKVAGILTELSAEIERINYIVIGIGVNVNQDINDFPEEFRENAISLKEAVGMRLSRVKILQWMLEEIEKTYHYYLAEGLKPILAEWRNYSLTIGREVEVIMGNERIKGSAVDVGDDGSLIVKDENNIMHKIIAGDVSLRGKWGSYAGD
ncbi:MAG: biotin--[acetyl-CoA-carboxylase] ligase [Bacillota bacterium]